MEDEKTNFFDFLEQDPRRLDPDLEKLGALVVDVFIEVHRHLGPGHPERVYENAVCKEFELRKVPFQRQVSVRVHYKGYDVGDSVLDILVAEQIIIELKSVEQLSPVHRAQLGSYLIATNLKLGYLANFNVALIKHGIKRVVRSS